jgi:hypothetical protein
VHGHGHNARSGALRAKDWARGGRAARARAGTTFTVGFATHRLPCSRTAPDDGRQPPWLRQHDLAVRHLVDGADELAAEVQHVHGLLNGAATIAATRDADAQEQLNSVAVVAAVGSGVPGLIFALYGADVLVPFTEGSRQLAVLGLIFLVTILVLMFVLSRLHPARAQRRRC